MPEGIAAFIALHAPDAVPIGREGARRRPVCGPAVVLALPCHLDRCPAREGLTPDPELTEQPQRRSDFITLRAGWAMSHAYSVLVQTTLSSTIEHRLLRQQPATVFA